VEGALDLLVDGTSYPEIRVPVWDTYHTAGSNGYYHVVGFAVVRLTGYDLPGGGGNYISAQFMRWDNDACPGNGH
jgi:hypothetical protein